MELLGVLLIGILWRLLIFGRYCVYRRIYELIVVEDLHLASLGCNWSIRLIGLWVLLCQLKSLLYLIVIQDWILFLSNVWIIRFKDLFRTAGWNLWRLIWIFLWFICCIDCGCVWMRSNLLRSSYLTPLHWLFLGWRWMG